MFNAIPHVAPRTRSRRFDVGDRVVHPHHGAGEVVRRSRRRMLGSVRDYLEIEMAHPSMRILVPCDGAAAVGLRPIVGRRRLRRIVEVLQGEAEIGEGNWSARQKQYRARLKGGDVLELAAVVRDLGVRAAGAELSSSERALFERSRQVLASELAYALGVGAERAGAYIDEHVGSRGAEAADDERLLGANALAAAAR